MQDTDSGNFHSGNTRSGSVHNFHTDPDDDIEDLYVDADEEIPEGEESAAPAGIRRFLNFHVLFALVLLIVVGVVGYRVTHWGQRISQSDIFKDGQGSYDDSWDSILPLTDENGQMIINDASNIVVFGNAPFADDRDSSDNLANLIAKETDTTVYNCSISGSYLAAQQLNYDPTVAPMDAYCLYWLVNLAVGVPLDGYYTDAANALGDKTPAEAEEVINTLKTLDSTRSTPLPLCMMLPIICPAMPCTVMRIPRIPRSLPAIWRQALKYCRTIIPRSALSLCLRPMHMLWMRTATM